MRSEREDNCAENFLWSASKLIHDLCKRNTSRESDLSSMRIAFRARRFNYMNFNKKKLHLCSKCYSSWKEGRFSMRIRANREPKSHKKRINLLVVRCNVCQNRCKSIVSKPESNIMFKQERNFLNVSNTLQPKKPNPLRKVSINKKKKKRKENLAGLNMVNVPPSNYSAVHVFHKNLKQNNSEELSDKPSFTNVDTNLISGKNVAMDDTKLSNRINSKHIEQSNSQLLVGENVSVDDPKLGINSNPFTSNNVINNVFAKCLIKGINKDINKSRNNKKKEKKRSKVNHLKNFLHSL